ncbi:MAG: Gfo/Idh/MocA family oxidoreductase [Gemmataceae bacterium]|nr:Gfo/Idh/MocA family oxidoreductase [Gemmataceae bacterium]
MSRSTRRSFLKQTAAAAIAAPMFVPNLLSQPPSRRVRHASFGAAGMGGADIRSLSSHPNLTMVAVADVDTARQADARKRFGDRVHFYQDWRQLLDKEAKNLDSVNVSTPDHMHAPIAMSAMQLGLHAYVQKPLAHDVYECRRLTEVARERKLISQMGIQVHSAVDYKLAVRLVQDGAVGRIREVHTWSNKKWGDPNPRPDRKDPAPDSLDWNGWIGVGPEQSFIGGGYYHPGNWRKRLDFGTGTFGDMGCHIYDPVFAALALTAPISVRSEGPPPGRHNWANDAIIHYVFPGTRYTAGDTVRVTWYDGDQRPPQEAQALIAPHKLPGQGSILQGTKGVMLIPHVARPVLLPEREFRDFRMPDVQAANHYHQFVNAILGEGRTSAGFDYSGPLTEAVLLGGVATHFPKTTLEWDSAKLVFRNTPDANRLIRRTYRKGWEVRGLSG